MAFDSYNCSDNCIATVSRFSRESWTRCKASNCSIADLCENILRRTFVEEEEKETSLDLICPALINEKFDTWQLNVSVLFPGRAIRG